MCAFMYQKFTYLNTACNDQIFFSLILTLQILLSLRTTFPKVGLLPPCEEKKSRIHLFAKDILFFLAFQDESLESVLTS